MPRENKVFDRMKEIAKDYEDSEYMYTNEERKYNGSAVELIKDIYQDENQPIKVRLYAATKASEYEPRVIRESETAESREENEREWHKILDYFAKAAINETIYQLAGRKPGSSGAPAWINPLVSEALRKCGAAPEAHASEIIEPGREPVVVRKQPDPGGIDGSFVGDGAENSRETAGERRRAASPSPRGVASAVILFTQPHKQFWVGCQRYSADERGEISCSDPAAVEALLRSGCKALAS